MFLHNRISLPTTPRGLGTPNGSRPPHHSKWRWDRIFFLLTNVLLWIIILYIVRKFI